MQKRFLLLLSVLFVQMALMQPAGAVDAVSLQGSGSSFVAPVMAKWTENFGNVSTGPVQISYASVGSGTGKANFIAGTTDFAGSDAPLSSTEVATITGNGQVALTMPDTIGAIVMIYNITTGLTGTLNLTAQNIADIYQGTVTHWNDSTLTVNNPGLTSTAAIVQVHRSDSSGTSFAFSNFLTLSTGWSVGTTQDLSSLGGVGGSHNDGVAGAVSNNANSIGYVELNYAMQNSLGYANVKNKDGNFVTATSAGIAAAAAAVATSLPAGDGNWSSVSINWASGADTYPIATFTYLMVYKDMSDSTWGTTGPSLVAFLHWLMTDDAQNLATPLGYIPLPTAVRTLNNATINSISVTGNYMDYWPGASESSSATGTGSTSASSSTSDSTAPGFEFISVALVFVAGTVIANKRRNNKN